MLQKLYETMQIQWVNVYLLLSYETVIRIASIYLD